jgi:hypothetical protein
MRLPARHVLNDADGFTLVELLASMAAGLVVLFASFSLIDFSLEATSRVTDRVDAVQQGRTAMERLVQELNSGCLTGEVSPIQGATSPGITPVVNTDASDIVFVSGVGDGTTATPTEHVVSFQNGELTDLSYTNTGGSPPTPTSAATWTFNPSPAAGFTLLGHVSQVDSNTPMFQYFSYSNPSNPTPNSLLGAAPLSPVPLNATWPPITGEANAAGAVARVDIAWTASPSSGLTDLSRQVTMNDSVVFRLTPASPSDMNYPCD